MITFLLILIDQVVKFFITTHYTIGDITTIIPGMLNVTYVENTGAAFSILSGDTYLIIIVSLAVLFVLYRYVLAGSKYDYVKALIVGGIVSNLIDRIFRGCVVDYIEVLFKGYNIPIFNIADICIVVGSILFIFKTLEEK